MNTPVCNVYGGLLHTEFGRDDGQKHQQVERGTPLAER